MTTRSAVWLPLLALLLVGGCRNARDATLDRGSTVVVAVADAGRYILNEGVHR